ncbi:MAG TPA: beta-N-acetylhexosaminidase [Terriglobia bacterium]|nr:beta-N-acetylhexosaminidase [Terriglobia bacterium]
MLRIKNARRLISCLACVVVLSGMPLVAATSSELFSRGYTVIPQPQKVESSGGDFEIGGGWRLQLGQGVKPDDVAVESLKEGLLTRHGVSLETRGRGSAIELVVQPGSVEIGPATDKNKQALEGQAYRLELAGSGIKITANAPTGLFYGVETLVQLVRHAQGKLWLPTATITDWPDLELRSIYWDDAHHLERIAVLKQALKQAAFYKINGFAIKLDGHFEFKSAPAVVEPYALSPQQLQDLTDFGLRYHIQLIPYIDGPGHIAFILKHPEYAKLRAFPDSNYELCTTNPGSYKLMEGMYQELLDANKGVKYFVLSTDEPYYVGLADNAQCNEAQTAKQLGSVGKLLAKYLTTTGNYVHDRGRNVIFWAGYPMVAGDIPELPSYLITRGANYNGSPEFARALKAHGIRGMIRTAPEGTEPLFPSYHLPPPSALLNYSHGGEQAAVSELNKTYQEVSFTWARKETDLIGVLIMAWGDEGLDPETFWLGYVTAGGWGWHPGSPGPLEASGNFYRLFYGQGGQNIGRLYELMSTQAEVWDSSWDREPSSARKPIFGNSRQVYRVRRPAHDQNLPLPPVPQGEYLRLGSDWGKSNARRVQMAQDAIPANDELLDLLHKNLRSVEFQKYNLQVYLSIAGLYRQNLEMIEEMNTVNGALEQAETAAANVQFERAVAALDRALDTVEEIRDQRNEAYHQAVETWYESWLPRVAEANGRKYLDEVDDVKDHLPMRTVDMSYLIYRELLLPLGKWYNDVKSARNQYAKTHGLPLRTKAFDWNDTQTVIKGDPVWNWGSSTLRQRYHY